MKKILIILGHPNKNSYCGSLAESYKKGALQSNAAVKELILADLNFDPILHQGYKQIQPLEPDLVRAQKLIKWADHLVFVFPTWWGTMPALLKGFFDRTFLPGYAFKYRENSSLWDKLLTGKTARIIVTMDAPRWYSWFIYSDAGIKAVKKATLEFCGIKPVAKTVIGGVKMLSEEKRIAWLERVESEGRNLR
jgi:NAD(P)H dehydrogenase (quinone)